MKRIFSTLFGIIITIGFLTSGNVHSKDKKAPDKKGSIVVNISKIETKRRRDDDCGKGNPSGVIVYLYNNEDTWQKPKKAFKKQIFIAKEDKSNVTFKDIPAGNYALSIIHDIECDGGFTMRWFPYPSPFDGVTASWRPEIKDTNQNPKWKMVYFDMKAGEKKTFNVKMTYTLEWDD